MMEMHGWQTWEKSFQEKARIGLKYLGREPELKRSTINSIIEEKLPY